MLKGSYTAIVASVLVHVFILLALIFSSIKSPKEITQEKPKVTAIKSFLYRAPKATVPKVIAKKPVSAKAILSKVPSKKVASNKAIPKEVLPDKAIEKVAEKITPVAKVTKPNQSVKQEATVPNNTSSALKANTEAGKKRANKQNTQSKTQSSFSSYDRLSRLREKLSNQNREDAFTELTQKRSASAMDGDQFPVPKTIVPLTQEQKYKQNTNTNHTGSITKNDNGTCTIHREQILGSPVEATTSYFGCGESKFDKSFREHMQKVQAKLGVKKR